jgi:hypothetical protein
LTKLGAVIQVPFRHGNQFLGEGGVQVSDTGNTTVYNDALRRVPDIASVSPL